jgi:antitoxin (DNA-binding transcriptional repressor) of toxin-antitoxin stability system
VTKTIDVHKEPTDLQGLLSLVAKGTEVILVEGNKPVARLVPIGKRVAGLHSGAMRTTEDFHEQLPEEFGQETSAVIPSKSMKVMRGSLKGLDTTVNRDDDSL